MSTTILPQTGESVKVYDNPLKLKGIHHVELLVGNAKQAAYFYRKAFGFSQIAYSGLETGNRHFASYVLEQTKIRLVLTTPLTPEGSVVEHLVRHGDGVKDICFAVADAAKAFEEAVSRNAIPVEEPHVVEDSFGKVLRSAIRTYGETVHSMVSPINYAGPFLPGYVPAPIEELDAGLLRIDHIVGNVELGAMNKWCDYYRDVLGFKRFVNFDDKDISTEYSALMSIVMSDDSQSVKFPINEPAQGRRKSQIQEYLDWYGSPGVQHIALQTGDIIKTVSTLRGNGVEFLEVPDTYYDQLQSRVGMIDEDMEMVRKLKILVDRDQEGYLLQLFTKPVEDRPTLFYEIIHRHGSRGFGKGNFKALFEAIEAEQARRGNL
ncbi:MAG TPA: 4-hydroxyphenylpyruvate dioxygenase [Bryobacteraceae bacterium]|jgi:4-hydroxyphenylpyruvate dioxygenase|nr:4-hydroxyphenylpyruvate dioxygenase [Bryobacteraceae bacterium]